MNCHCLAYYNNHCICYGLLFQGQRKKWQLLLYSPLNSILPIKLAFALGKWNLFIFTVTDISMVFTCVLLQLLEILFLLIFISNFVAWNYLLIFIQLVFFPLLIIEIWNYKRIHFMFTLMGWNFVHYNPALLEFHIYCFFDEFYA